MIRRFGNHSLNFLLHVESKRKSRDGVTRDDDTAPPPPTTAQALLKAGVSALGEIVCVLTVSTVEYWNAYIEVSMYTCLFVAPLTTHTHTLKPLYWVK